ncbi:MAG TPA: hypothetical protein VH877_01195 [Polyangia bacterium]|jgi:hypothetical protein|nr:hypothetical protein [Polyangia bacterium]
MIKRIEYGEYWSDYYQGWRYPFSEAEARRRHEAREIYTALIDQDDGSRLALELCFAFSYCNIFFLDAQGRCVLRHTFEPTDAGRLFLCEISTGEYEGDDRWPMRGISFNYTQDGRVKTLLCTPRSITVLGENEPADVRLHDEPVPAFGAWESLIRRDRTRPAGLPSIVRAP